MTAPAPTAPHGWDDVTRALRTVRARAGSPSFAQIARRVGAVRAARGLPAAEQRPGRVTVYDVFRPGRSRLDVELVVDVVRALGGTPDDVVGWRAAHAAVALRLTGGGAGAGSDEGPGGDPAASDGVSVLAAAGSRGLRPLADEPTVLVGRDAELAALVAVWTADDPAGGPDASSGGLRVADPDGTPRVAVVTGMPGVGKSALLRVAAGRWAAGRPVLVADPPDDDAEAIELAAGLIGRPPGLLLVDDLADAAALAALLGALPSGWALGVTSRRALPSSGRQVRLDPLPDADARALLVLVAGARRLAEDDPAVERIVGCCGGLPLALRVAGSRLRDQPGWTLADHAHRLGSSVHALPALDAAYDALPSDHAQVLRRLAQLPGPLPPVAAALLAGVDPVSVAGALAALEDENLLLTAADGSVVLHDVVRRFVLDRAEAAEPRSVRSAAARRLASWLADRADDLVPVITPQSLPPGEAPVAPVSAEQVGAGAAWFDRYRDVACAAAVACAQDGAPDLAQRLSRGFGAWLDLSGRWRQALALHTAAAGGGDPGEVVAALRRSARSLERLGRYDEALAALVRVRESGRDDAPSRTLNGIGNVQQRRGRLVAAEQSFARAAAAAQADGDVSARARAHCNRGNVLRVLGRYDEARAELAACEQDALTCGDRAVLGIGRVNLGVLHLQVGELAAARAVLSAVADDPTQAGDVARGARATLAEVALLSGDPATAAAVAREVVAQGPDASVLADARIVLARALAAGGDRAGAQVELLDVLAAAQRARMPVVEAEARTRLGELAAQAGDRQAAVDWFRSGLAAARAIADHAETARARAGLAALGAAEAGEPTG